MKKLFTILSIGAISLLTSCHEGLAPFPEVGEAYAITQGPQDHLLASYFGINSWSPDGRYVAVLGVDFSGRLPEVTDSGFGGLPVKGLFEVCADVKNVHFDNIQIQHTVDEFKEKDIKVIKVGPLSETFKNGPDPANWNEMFYPDDICTMKDTHIGKIQFSDKVATESERNEVIAATKMTLNEDYPNTTPKGGTGYGIIDNVIFE